MRLRVLIVDDSDDDVLLLVRELRRGGFDLFYHKVYTSAALRKALNQNNWDIVLTDHSMPQFSSFDVLDLTRSINNNLPVIVVSGHIGEEVAVETMHAGARDYIMKDNLKRLVPAIKRELRELKVRLQHRRAQETIRYLAFHDSLTGLVNRHELENQLEQVLGEIEKNNGQHALLYMDLDEFKMVNDTCGHAAGDALLRKLSILFRNLVRKCDTFARLGGDEFAVLLRDCPIDFAQQIAENIRQAVEKYRFEWDEQYFNVGISIGVVGIDKSSLDCSEILSSADMACYAAKDKGRNRVHICMKKDSEISHRCRDMRWVSNIHRSLKDNRFLLFWQAIVPLNEKLPNSVYHEFLLRLEGMEGELISPSAFIPPAERYNLMPTLDRFVIDRSFAYIAQAITKQKNLSCPNVYFINLSGKSLSDYTFFSYVSKKMKEYNVPPELICFEVTETAAIYSLDQAIEFIKRMKRQGCLFALDDFGSGLSSFSYLKSFPIDFIKIDGSFIRNMADNITDCSIVEAINQIGHVNGIKTIAEFVETEHILDKVREIGLDYAQGYEIGHPDRLPQ